jgi:hypothetical protein
MPLASVPGAQRERALAKLLPQNGILAELSEDSRARLLPHFALADLPAGQQLGDPGGRHARAFFPLTGVVTLIDDSGRLVSMAGNEGVVGLPRFISEAALARPVVQCAGYALALGREPLLEEWALGGSFMRLLSQFSRTTAVQADAVASCRVQHELQQRLCTLLSMSLDRHFGEEVVLSQEAAARLLGAAGPQVEAAVEGLCMAGAASWRRPGVFAVRQHPALRSRACGCAVLPADASQSGAWSAPPRTASTGRAAVAESAART